MKIDILDSDFPRLQALAQPFVDTPATVVSKLLDAFEGRQVDRTLPENSPRESSYSLEALPPLTHAKVMGGHFNGVKPSKHNWDSFVRHSLIEVLKKAGSVDDLRRLSGANIREGRFEDHGYKYVPEHRLSFQGVSAEDAVKIIGRCGRALNVPFEIEFVWRDKPDAHRPGERGRIKYP
ncbi:MAG: T4SS efffector SepA family protein [Tsuneonella sp.]